MINERKIRQLVKKPMKRFSSEWVEVAKSKPLELRIPEVLVTFGLMNLNL